MVKRHFFISAFLIFLIGLFNGCAKSENFFAYGSDKVNKKIIPGKWDIEMLEIWIVDDVQTNAVMDYLVFENIGNFEFMEGGECHFNLIGGSLDATYLTLYSTDAWEWSYLAGSFAFYEHFNGNVISMDRDEMVIMMPWTLNLYLTDRVFINKSVEFRFKLKKQ